MHSVYAVYILLYIIYKLESFVDIFKIQLLFESWIPNNPKEVAGQGRLSSSDICPDFRHHQC